jgi:CRISPR/Cas system CSM-associated protein Csm3 (group 7 of RAMP superfamily)
MPFDHVAIDRFTGGASDQKKFDALAAMGGVFHVELTADRVHDEETARWIIGLLALVLRDLHDGRLWLGHGGAKGHGLMQLAKAPSWTVPADWNNPADDLPGCVAALWKLVEGEHRDE